MQPRAFITGISATGLNAAERAFIESERPWGFILFKRNIETPKQLALLVEELKRCAGRPEVPILIDQEGGRVQRLGPPHWPVYPPGALFGALYDLDPALGLSAARLSARLIAADLLELGINVNCLPLADVPVARVTEVAAGAGRGQNIDGGIQLALVSQIGGQHHPALGQDVGRRRSGP